MTLHASTAEDSDLDRSDNEVSAAEHSRLLAAISQLDEKQRVKPPSRKEPSLQVSEFHLVQSGEGRGNAVHLQDLAKVLESHGTHSEISRKLRVLRRKGRTLPKPLEKPIAEKIQRTVGFNKLRREVSRWEATVQKNRVADHLSFPLNQGSVTLDTSKQFFNRFKTQSPLEAQVAEILNNSKCVEEEREEAEEEFPLSLEELAQRRKEMAHLRAQQSYQEAKARRQNKIKSKKYHRVQRRERIRQQLKEFEVLQKKDPGAALEQLQQLERVRAEERMTLRHRNTGQWARNRAIRAKYDPQSRQALAEQLAISRDLTKKLQDADSSGQEDEKDITGLNTENLANNDNPWIATKTTSEIENFVSGYRRYWEKQNKELATDQSKTVSKETGVHSQQLENGDQVEEVQVRNDDHSDGSIVNFDSGSSVEDKSEEKIVEEVVCEHKTASVMKKSPRKANKKLVDGGNKEGAMLLGQIGTNVAQGVQHTISDKNVKHKQKNISLFHDMAEKMGDKLRKEIRQPLPEIGERAAATSSLWVVTPIKSTKDKKRKRNDEAKKMLQESGSGCQKTKDKMHIDRSNIQLDDLFDDMEDKLNEKVTKKLEKLRWDIRSTLKPQIQKEKQDVNMDIGEPSLKMKAKIVKPQQDEKLNEMPGHGVQSSKSIPSVPVVPLTIINKETSQKDDIDPNKFMSVKPKILQTRFPDMITGGDEGLDNEEEDHQMTIAEAFTGDDVVAEFTQEKEDIVEKSKPQDIDLSLPGWGSWGGKNISQNKRKKRRFIIKLPKDVPRRDDNKGHLIINEDKDTKVKEHQVNEIPFPFTSVKDFEASIRAPIGNTWVPETAHRKLIEPPIQTKLGTIIHPMDEDVLVSKKKKVTVIKE